MSYDPWHDMVAIHNQYLGKELVIWTVYNSPSDFPGVFVVRPFVDEKVLPWAATCNQIEPLRDRLERLGLTCLGRSPEDDQNIVESWI